MAKFWLILGSLFAVLLVLAYGEFKIDVPEKHIGVLTRKTGLDIPNDEEVAPTSEHKGLQLQVKTEGRDYLNPFTYDWAIYPMVEIPENRLGIRIRLYGKDLPYGHFVSTADDQKGIVKEVLRPGRYPLNARVINIDRSEAMPRTKQDYVEIVEYHSPVTIQAGFRGVVTNLAGPMPDDPNKLLSPEGFRGVQEKSLEPGTYYLNPYMYKVHSVDCRSQRFNLAEGKDMGFPSKDGFWVSLDGIIEFRVNPDKVAEVFVMYNEDLNGEIVDAEIINKVILPNARSFCRLKGSNSSGREFIGGETRTNFQNAFQESLTEACKKEGIDIVQALITRIIPPEAIADPVRRREVAHQKQQQYTQEKLQQDQEALLAKEIALVAQKQDLVGTDQEVNKKTIAATQMQETEIKLATQLMEVAEKKLEAAKDEAAAIITQSTAAANVIQFENQANAAGWKRAIEAMGSGDSYAQFVLYQKLAPSFRSIMSNTADSPLMKMFETQNKKEAVK